MSLGATGSTAWDSSIVYKINPYNFTEFSYLKEVLSSLNDKSLFYHEHTQLNVTALRLLQINIGCYKIRAKFHSSESTLPVDIYNPCTKDIFVISNSYELISLSSLSVSWSGNNHEKNFQVNSPSALFDPKFPQFQVIFLRLTSA